MLYKTTFTAIAVMCLIATNSAMAQMKMTSSQIKTTLAGKTLFLATPLGSELPIRFSRGGAVSGSAGYLARYLSRKKVVKRDRGSWWVRAGRMCKRWKNWFGGKTHCFRLTKSGNKIRWVREDGKSGSARIGR